MTGAAPLYGCCEPRRRELVLADPVLNGIDFVEVLDREAPPGTPRQRTLILRFLKDAPPLGPAQVEITGGERVTGIAVERVTPAAAPSMPGEPGLEAWLLALPDPGRVLAVRVSAAGDHSTYALRLVAAPGALGPPAGIDLLLAAVEFSFKAECPTDFDCAPTDPCAPEEPPAPAISYLAKDYESFRRLMLGRMALLLPDWRERSPADLGVTLVEALAYVGDRLSWAQDAAATEGWIGTARSRVSVRRHARLVDYAMDDGANARAFVHLSVTQDGGEVRRGRERFLTRLPGLGPTLSPLEEERALDRGPEVFEPLHDAVLRRAHNEMRLYAWGSVACHLPRGATRATLRDDGPEGPLALGPGDVVIFEERLGPRTGAPADADPAHRHAVRLTAVEAGLVDAVGGVLVVEVRWGAGDALPFPLCVSARLSDAAGGGLVEDVSVAVGNLVLCDHGLSLAGEDLGAVPEPHLRLAAIDGDPCAPGGPAAVPPRYAPRLARGPLAQEAAHDPAASARAALAPPRAARRPALRLRSATPLAPPVWTAVGDLLGSLPGDAHVVAEVEADGMARLRFGDDAGGRRPEAGTAFVADYRVGNGAAGNVGREAVAHVVTTLAGIAAVRNPLPATGGVDPETTEAARAAAPHAWRRQERAVTEADYAAVAHRHPEVQRAAATFRWNGHGHTVFVTVDRMGGRAVDAAFRAELGAFLDRFRMAGYDVRVDAPRFVAVEIELFVCARPGHLRPAVRRAVLERLGAGTLAGGGRGFFHPDNFSFGDPVRRSAVEAAAMEVEGVASVETRAFGRRGRPEDRAPLDDGTLAIGRLEVARMENDPDFPERGSLVVEAGGGR